MAKQLGFYFEQKHCIGCCTCQLACKDKHNLPVGQLFRRVFEITGGNYEIQGKAVIPNIYAYWVSISCNHCQNPVCITKCPKGAIHKRTEDGIVFIDQDSCIGCKICVKSCPYGAPQYNLETGKVNKCDFCRDLLAEGKPPECVGSCPLRALDFGPLDELKRKYGTVNETQGLPAADITQPSLVITPHRHACNFEGKIDNA